MSTPVSIGAPKHAPSTRGLRALTTSAMIALCAAGGAFSWHSAIEHILVLATIATLSIAMVLLGRRRQKMSFVEHLATTRKGIYRSFRALDPIVAGAGLWAAFFASLLALDLLDLFDPSSTRPTLSHLAGKLSAHYLGHVALFAAWVATGWWVILSGHRVKARSK